MVAVGVREDHVVDDSCSVVGLQVLDNLISSIQISTVHDVYARSAIHRIAQRDRIPAFRCFDAKKIDLEVVSHTSLMFYAQQSAGGFVVTSDPPHM
ncbi:hypothetical protein D9M68_950840 [compost metagenome]